MAETRTRADVRERIVDVAARLLTRGGPGAVTTRGVAEGAGVQAPTIYRLFGDKDGLLEAVAEHVMAEQVSAKAAVVATATARGVDPLADLRAGWDFQLAFGLANPALFRLLSDPERVARSAAAQAGRAVLESRVHRVATAGRLRVSERRAVGLIQAAGIGAITTMLATPPAERDPELADSLYEAVLSQILTGVPAGGTTAESSAGTMTATVVAFRAAAPQLTALTPGERHVLLEWLDRVIEPTGTAAHP